MESANTDNFEDLFLGLVGAVGSDLQELSTVISSQLSEYNYSTEIIKLTEILSTVFKEIKSSSNYNSEFDRISSYMDAGNKIRKESGNNDILVRNAMAKISKLHKKSSQDGRRAYIFNSLKHHEEIKLLRQVYGGSFYLVGLHSTIEKRISNLMGVKNIPEDKAKELILRDQEETFPHGQKLRKSYQLSDVFIDGSDRDTMVRQSKRFIELLFGFPYHTPNPEEHNMFQAYAASLRSSDLSRQVGAVIVSKEGDIIAQGANDVPKAKGGLYNNEDKPDARDFQKKYDSNEKRRNSIMKNILNAVQCNQNGQFTEEQMNILEVELEKSEIRDITEYGRAVHAEMEALLAAARVGTSVRGGTLYTTTYSCHNCAKHIVAAGIMKVVYVEPYPKSLTEELHKDSISLDKENETRVSFLPFLGVGPRRYFDLFSLKLSSGREVERKENGHIIDFEPKKKSISLRLSEKSNKYIGEEKIAAKVVHKYLKEKED